MWECPLCGERVEFSRTYAVIDHFEDAHNKHVNGNDDQEYYCLCGERFGNWNDLESHYRFSPHDWPRILTTRELESM